MKSVFDWGFDDPYETDDSETHITGEVCQFGYGDKDGLCIKDIFGCHADECEMCDEI